MSLKKPQKASETEQLSATPMRDDTETNDTVSGNSDAALESDGNGVAVARSDPLRNADYESLTRRAATDNSRALIVEVLRLVATVEPRKRQRGAKAIEAFGQAVERFVGDLLVARAKARHNEHGNNVAGWVRHSVSPNAFTGGPVSARTFVAIRTALTALGLVEEVPGITQFREVFGKQFVLSRYDTRWRATTRLAELAAARGVSLLDRKPFHLCPRATLAPLGPQNDLDVVGELQDTRPEDEDRLHQGREGGGVGGGDHRPQRIHRSVRYPRWHPSWLHPRV